MPAWEVMMSWLRVKCGLTEGCRMVIKARQGLTGEGWSGANRDSQEMQDTEKRGQILTGAVRS